MSRPITRAPAEAAGALPPSERIPTLDILRGFALMGILIMNMPGFSYSGFHEADGSHYWPSAIDRAAEQIRDTLFSGKFNSLFSVLFGLGFTIQPKSGSYPVAGSPGGGFGGPMTGAMRSLM
jgi:uncharacterized protein